MFRLTPREDKFYDLFIDFSRNILDAANMLRNFVYDLSDPEEKLKEIKYMETECDKKLHVIFKELNKTFITPIDREDIYMIGKQMDEIVDFIEATACRFVIFHVNTSTQEARLLTDLIIESARQFIVLMEEFKSMNKSEKLIPTIVEINRLEEVGDDIYRKAVKRLFSETVPVLDVIKWREIYEHLENTLDAMEDVANTVEGVVMKHV